jgi:sterol desaturase/sphingolipid hydroxylase (fatty acid hydroxylase superfamily)
MLGKQLAQYPVADRVIAGREGEETMRPGRGGVRLTASTAVVWLLPLGALLLAFATNGVTRSLSRQYLQGLIASLLITVAFAFLERLLPSTGPRKRAPLALLNIQAGIVLFVGVTVSGVLAGFVAAAIGHHLGMGWIDLKFWSKDNFPALAATVLMSWLITDFAFYWYHRSQHTFALLWQVHKFHHMDEQVSATTRLRDNVSDTLINMFFMSIPIALLFRFDPVATAKLSTFLALANETIAVFIHSNIRLSLGWASVLMVGPQLHRIHHSRLIQHHNRNYCVYFPIWDILFRTYYHPSRAEFPPTGIDEARDVSSIREVVVLPFQGWWAILCGWRQRHT